MLSVCMGHGLGVIFLQPLSCSHYPGDIGASKFLFKNRLAVVSFAKQHPERKQPKVQGVCQAYFSSLRKIISPGGPAVS